MRPALALLVTAILMQASAASADTLKIASPQRQAAIKRHILAIVDAPDEKRPPAAGGR